jgi:rhodanese-related sulfurtransferase
MNVLTFAQNHWMLVALLLTFIVAYALFEIRQHWLGPKRLAPSLATQFINRQSPLIFDLRDKSKFDAGHIINAQSVPQAEAQATLEKLKKPFSTPILLICQTGQHSAVLGARLKKQGFTEVMSLGGGMNAWQHAELPVEKKR